MFGRRGRRNVAIVERAKGTNRLHKALSESGVERNTKAEGLIAPRLFSLFDYSSLPFFFERFLNI